VWGGGGVYSLMRHAGGLREFWHESSLMVCISPRDDLNRLVFSFNQSEFKSGRLLLQYRG